MASFCTVPAWPPHDWALHVLPDGKQVNYTSDQQHVKLDFRLLFSVGGGGGGGGGPMDGGGGGGGGGAGVATGGFRPVALS